jgi:acid phosphatase
MNRVLAALLTLASLACATTTTPAGGAAAASAAGTPAPCIAGHSIVNATLWVQSAAEYRASALQTYAAATRALDAALADPSWSAASEEQDHDATQPPAVILDLDETTLDNTGFEARVIRKGLTYDSAMWKQWTSEGIATPIPGAAEFLAYAKSRGVTPFYITNRDIDEEPGTLRNLQTLGFPLDPKNDTLLMQGKREWATGDKAPRRAHVASTHRVLVVLGDDLNDFANAREATKAERDAIIDHTKSWWGTRWFILPNPMYGSFERAAIGRGGTPCEQLQRKIDALR